MATDFANAIADVVLAQLNTTSDGLIRLNCSQDWPMEEALAIVAEGRPLRLLILRPFSVADFEGFDVTSEPQVATQWRNQTDRSYVVVILGRLSGDLDAGLRDIRLVEREEVLDSWKRSILSKIDGSSDLNNREVPKLVSSLFKETGASRVPVRDLEDFFKHLFVCPEISDISKNLWRAGLVPDNQALDTNRSSDRISRNLALVSSLTSGDDPKIDNRLEASAGSENTETARIARAAQEFRQSPSKNLLQTLELTVLDSILKESSPPTSSRTLTLFDLLDLSSADLQTVRRTIAEFSAELQGTEDFEFELKNDVCIGEETKRVSVRFELPIRDDPENNGPERPLVLWSGERGVLAFNTTEETFDPRRLKNWPPEMTLTASSLARIGTFPTPLVEFLEARAELEQAEPFLATAPLEFLILSATGRRKARTFIEKWVQLAACLTASRDAKSFLKAFQFFDTIRSVSEENELQWIALGVLHPYRLDPILRIAEEIDAFLSGDSVSVELGKAARWMFDRCYPAYPTFFTDEGSVPLSSTSDHVVYSFNTPGNLPTVRDSVGLDQVIRAIESFSPWLSDGMAILAVDPPGGSAVSSCLRKIYERNRGALRFYYLATSNQSSVTEDYPGEVTFLPPARSLEDLTELPDSNILLRFVPEPSGTLSPVDREAATKGSHLALELDFAEQDAFDFDDPDPVIKIALQRGNSVVLGFQHIQEILTGNRPKHAQIRPLMKSDDASALSRLASSTDWIIFAAPGPLGLVAPPTINSTLRFVGRSSAGVYGLYVYAANDLYPVRKAIEERFRSWPIGSMDKHELVERLVRKARETGRSVLFSMRSDVESHIAAMVALDQVLETLPESAISLVVSLDDLGWVSAWMDEGRRADFLIFSLDSSDRSTITVIESKSVRASDPIGTKPTTAPYPSAIHQVQTTLEQIRSIVSTQQPKFNEDLRHANLLEHLMAVGLATSDRLEHNSRQRLFSSLNRLSVREEVPDFKGFCVVTQISTKARTETRRLDDTIDLIWAGAEAVERMLGVSGVSGSESELAGGISATRSGPSVDTAPESSGGNGPIQAESESDRVHSGTPKQISDLITAMKLHGIPVSNEHPAFVELGPTLIAAGISVSYGSSLADVRRNLDDIARDAGLGQFAEKIDISNDKRRSTLRVLVPREDRVFPDLRESNFDPVSELGYLPLKIGQTVSGDDFVTSIEKWPHLLIAGTTGGGKTTFIKSILKQLGSFGPDNVEVVVVDGKGDIDYFGLLPRAIFSSEFPDVQLGSGSVNSVLEWAVTNMDERQRLLLDNARARKSLQGPLKASDLYRQSIQAGESPLVKPLVIVIDEFADIMLSSSKKSASEFETLVQRIAQVGRSRLIHIILATQRPDKNTIKGSIKANLNARAVFRLPTTADSMTVLGRSGAEKLLPYGDFLFATGDQEQVRLQGFNC